MKIAHASTDEKFKLLISLIIAKLQIYSISSTMICNRGTFYIAYE